MGLSTSNGLTEKNRQNREVFREAAEEIINHARENSKLSLRGKMSMRGRFRLPEKASRLLQRGDIPRRVALSRLRDELDLAVEERSFNKAKFRIGRFFGRQVSYRYR